MMSVRRYVLLTDIIGLACVLLALVTLPQLPAPLGVPQTANLALVLAVVLIILVGQAAYVRVRHGATTEELNFLEAGVAIALITVPGRVVLVAGIIGIALAEIILRRQPIKMAYNVGSWATSASLMVILFYALSGGEDRFSARSVLAMVTASLVFATWNLTALAWLMNVNGGTSWTATLRDEWRLSGLIGAGGAGLGMVSVALAANAPALLPFAALPALGLWFAYSAAAQHAEARERNRWLIRLGGALAQHGRGSNILSEAAEAVRQVVGAPEMVVLKPSGPERLPTLAESHLLSAVAEDPGPRALTAGELPHNWTTGVATRLDLGLPSPGALLLGSAEPYRPSRLPGRTRGWSIDEADVPVLGALVAALGSSLTAGAAFDALEEETAKLTAVVDNTSDGIAMVDDAGRIRLWSQTMARMTGVEGGQLLLVDRVEALPAVVQDLVRTGLAARDGGVGTSPSSEHVHLVRPDGEELDVLVSTVRVAESTASDEGSSGGWVSILTVHDETRERRVERMKTDFIATISHELRTPITPIKGYAHLLATRGDRVPPAKRQAALETISDRADHLARLVDDLLLASRVSDGARLAVEIGVEDLQDVITTAVGMFPHISERILVAPLPAPIAVQCDRVRAVQCLSNLIGNAAKYTPPETTIELHVVATQLQVAIHVRDHGPGIPQAEQARVFERFYRIEDPFTMKTGGAGLGLHIARELAIAMGGGLALESPPGGGADFVLHLLTTDAPPVGKSTATSQAQIAPPADSAGQSARGSARVPDSEVQRPPAGGMARGTSATIHPAGTRDPGLAAQSATKGT